MILHYLDWMRREAAALPSEPLRETARHADTTVTSESPIGMAPRSATRHDVFLHPVFLSADLLTPHAMIPGRAAQ